LRKDGAEEYLEVVDAFVGGAASLLAEVGGCGEHWRVCMYSDLSFSLI